MNWQEIKQKYITKQRKKPNEEEHRIQSTCVRWFRLQYRTQSKLLFAIPNGGRRDIVTAAKMKEEGVVAGVADLFLAIPCNGYHGLWIEMKTSKGRQQTTQKEFEKSVLEQGYQYKVCRSLNEFMNIIKEYLKYE